MSETYSGESGSGAIGDEKRRSAAISLARWLGFAAAPSFAIMALVTGLAGGPNMLCSGTHDPLGGMAPMYALMSLFHAGPWLRRISRRRGGSL